MQAFRKLVKQFAEVAVLRDRFGHFQQRLVARFRRSAGRYVNGRFAHRLENNTEFLNVSTLARKFVKLLRRAKL